MEPELAEFQSETNKYNTRGGQGALHAPELETEEYGHGKYRESSAGETVSPSFAMKADSFVDF